MNSERLVGIASAALVSLSCSVASAQGSVNTVEEWLERMNTAVEQLNYRGTFVYDDDIDGNLQTIHIVHRYADGAVSERISSQMGGEILRTGDTVRWTFPNDQLVIVEQPYESAIPLASSLSYTADLEHFYQMTTFPSGIVADRETQVVSINARDEYRYGYLLWLDRETALPLKMQVRDEDDQVVQSFLFTDISIHDSIPEFIVDAPQQEAGFTWTQPEQAEPGASSPEPEVWGATRLPNGFKLSSSQLSYIGPSPYPVQHLVYSDGLATVSVFIARYDAAHGMPEGFSHFGCANAYSVLIDGYLATAIGEVPRLTVQTIATSLDAG